MEITSRNLTRKCVGEVQVAEILDGEKGSLDFVVFYFCFNKINHPKVLNLIDEYRKKSDACLIGCVDFLGTVIGYIDDDLKSDFTGLCEKFDLHLQAATQYDFENLIQFCHSTEISAISLSPKEVKNIGRKEIQVVHASGNSVDSLVDNIKSVSDKLFCRRNLSFSNSMVSVMSNDNEVTLDGYRKILQAASAFMEKDYKCFWNAADSMPDLRPDEIKAVIIFCED